jgi:hypothetical protein
MQSLYAIMHAYHDAIEAALNDHAAAMRRLGISIANDDEIELDDDAMPLAAMMTRERD